MTWWSLFIQTLSSCYTTSWDSTALGGTLTLNNTNVNGNSPGGITSLAALTVANSTISGNVGTGIDSRGTLTLTTSTVSGNTFSGGGGIRIDGPTTVSHSTISGNTAGNGGGIFSVGGVLTFANSTVSNNTAKINGGGIYIGRASFSSTNNTVGSNTATGQGGGIYNLDGTAKLANTIIAGNTASMLTDCRGVLESLGHNLVGDATGCEFLAAAGDRLGTAASPIDPLLNPLADNNGPTLTHGLNFNSPAIDAGDDNVPLITDQRGFPRLMGAHVDIGAYEFEPAQSDPLTVTKTGDTSDGFCGVVDCSLREAIGSGDSGDTVNIPAGVYTLTLGTELVTNTNLTLAGDGPDATIIQAAASSASATSRVLNITGSTLVISGVNIRHGRPPAGPGVSGGGGGIFNDGRLTLTNSVVSSNRASSSHGGGIFNRGSLTIVNSTLRDNSTSNASGGAVENWSTLVATNSTFSGNNAFRGGGIRNVGTLTLTNSTITGNATTEKGGGIFNEPNQTLTLANTIVAGNTRSRRTRLRGFPHLTGTQPDWYKRWL